MAESMELYMKGEPGPKHVLVHYTTDVCDESHARRLAFFLARVKEIVNTGKSLSWTRRYKKNALNLDRIWGCVVILGYTDRGFLVRVVIITIRFGARNAGKRLVRAWVNLIAPTSSGFHYRVHERGGGLPCGNGGGPGAFFVFLLVGFSSGLEKARKAKGSSFLAAATYAPRSATLKLQFFTSQARQLWNEKLVTSITSAGQSISRSLFTFIHVQGGLAFPCISCPNLLSLLASFVVVN
ncbi:hypothetical protein IMY05_002G0078800 [Salix suchowensis]|nr:hypothetical protein IMY05_002G0078800 [Salix suchowensis]